jgi:hypothetical protein
MFLMIYSNYIHCYTIEYINYHLYCRVYQLSTIQFSLVSLIFLSLRSMFSVISNWVLFLAYLNLFGIKDFVVVVQYKFLLKELLLKKINRGH